MFKNMLYSRRVFFTVLALVLIPFLLITFFYLNFQIKKVYSGYEDRVSIYTKSVQKKVSETSYGIMQKARFLVTYSELNDILDTDQKVKITPKIIEQNSEINNMIGLLFSDSTMMGVKIYTTNINAIIINNVEDISKTDILENIDVNKFLGEWRCEKQEDEILLCFYKKYGFDENTNVLKIYFPLRLILTAFEDFDIENSYIKILSHGEEVCVFNYKNNHFNLCELPDRNYYNISNEIEPIGLTVSVCIDKKLIYKDIFYIVIKIVFFALCIFAAYYYISKFAVEKNMQEVKYIINDIKNNNGISNTAKNEKNEMVLIRKYILELKNKFESESEEKLKFESSLMASRLSPHFLYNNLSAIRNNCQTDEAKKAIDNLVIYYRNVFCKGAYTTTLKKEVDNGVEYLNLLKFSYGTNFEIECDIDSQCDDVLIPSNILQPILENSFIHGVNDIKTNDTGVISIHVFKENDNVTMTITDNGGNFNRERYLYKINNSEDKHALRIIKERMKVFYKDDEHSVSIDGDSGKTVVTFVFAFARE